MTPASYDIEQVFGGKLHGTIDFGYFQMTYDFRELFKQRRRELEIEERQHYFILNGRIMMPALNII